MVAARIADYIPIMRIHTLHQSSSSDHRRKGSLTWLRSRNLSRGGLVIGASRTSADEIVRDLAALGTAVFGLYHLSLLQVIRSIAASASVEPSPSVGSLGQKAILSRAVDALRSEEGLGRFVDVAEAPGFVQAASDAIEEIGQQQISDDQMGEATPDFGRLVKVYRAALHESGMIDRGRLPSSDRSAIE